jgi:Zn-finger nucleic acid-binding protein
MTNYVCLSCNTVISMHSDIDIDICVRCENQMWDWYTFESLIDNDIRKRVHSEIAPCTDQEFLDLYLKYDPDFKIN